MTSYFAPPKQKLGPQGGWHNAAIGGQTMDEQLANPNLVDLRGKTSAAGSGPGGTVANSYKPPTYFSPASNGPTISPSGGGLMSQDSYPGKRNLDTGLMPGEKDTGQGPGTAKPMQYFPGGSWSGGTGPSTGTGIPDVGYGQIPDVGSGSGLTPDPKPTRDPNIPDVGSGQIPDVGSGTGLTGGGPYIQPPTDQPGTGQVPTTKPTVDNQGWEVYTKPPIVEKSGPGEFYDPNRGKTGTGTGGTGGKGQSGKNQNRVDELWNYGQGAMANPSRYDSDLVKQGAQVIQDAIDRMNKTGMRNISEQMAQRGLTGSSLEGFAAADLQGELGRYGNERMFNLAQDQANTWANDSSAAFGMGMGATGMGEQIDSRLAGNRLQGRGLDLQGRGLDINEAQGNRSLDIQETGQGMDESYRRWAAQQGFDLQGRGLNQSQMALLASLKERYPKLDLTTLGFTPEQIAALGDKGGEMNGKDSDGDGIPDSVDKYPNDPYKSK